MSMVKKDRLNAGLSRVDVILKPCEQGELKVVL